MKTNYKLSAEELAELEKGIRQEKRLEVRQRAVVIRMLHLGQKPEEIAEQQMVSVPTIYNWHKQWRKEGLEGLANKVRKGRKPKANDTYCTKLEEILEKEPSDYGYRFAIWTTDRLRAHLEKETGILLSGSRFRALLKKKEYRYKRPKYDLNHLQDQAAKHQTEEVLEELKKRASETISSSSLWTK